MGVALSLAPLLALTPAGAGETPVTVLDDAFQSETVRVSSGTTVTWIHRGKSPHSITADDGSFDSGRLDPGDRFSFTFRDAGTHPYHCIYHGASGGRGMAGVVLVDAEPTEPSEPTTPPPGRGESSW